MALFMDDQLLHEQDPLTAHFMVTEAGQAIATTALPLAGCGPWIFSVGRECLRCDVVINSRTVAGRHADIVVELTDGQFSAKVAPRRTANKSRIQGMELREGRRYPLKNSSELCFGQVSCRLMVPTALSPPWSPALHFEFPPVVRARAIDLLLVGHLLAKVRMSGRPAQRSGRASWWWVRALQQPRRAAAADTARAADGGLTDIWVAHVMPLVLGRVARYDAEA